MKNTTRWLNRIGSIGAMAAGLLLMQNVAYSQNWQLVWADEFNGSIGPDWSFETGTGPGGGWGNNELEYYQPQNATIVTYPDGNGALAITAKRESIGGRNYTSARMKTQGHKSWKYGKITARIALPGFQGSWPAFWMLGDNIGSVGWPQCGELDIMEQINTVNTVYGSTHWYSGGQADFSGNTGVDISNLNWHEYSITWDAQYIKWFVDGNQYNQFYIGGNAGGTVAFNQNNFFILLNLAVGGNWPGFTINDSALPASMYVDYVRVYQDAPPPAQGVYYIGSYGNGGKALQGTLDPYYNGSSYASGCNEVAETPFNSNSYQLWSVIPIGGGQYHIMNKATGQLLQSTHDSYIGQNGAVGGCNKVALTPAYLNNANQTWQIPRAALGYAIANPANSQYVRGTLDPYASGCYKIAGIPYSWGVSGYDEWSLVWVSN